jgi:uncharacterized protein YcbK (DUF882 family)
MTATDLPFGRYFKPSEFACKDGTPYPEEWDARFAVLLDVCDTIREAWGNPVTVVSGYRTPTYNVQKKGAKASLHMEGKAVDLRPYAPRGIQRTVATIHALHNLVNLLIEDGKLPAVGGVGSYPLVEDKRSHIWVPGWVHCDIRTKPASGRIARWEGAKTGDEQTA